MKLKELLDELRHYGEGYVNEERTCDTLKCGDIEADIKKVAVTMMPNADTIRRAAEWGADLMICHEPLYYVHMDKTEGREEDPVIRMKKELVAQSGMAIFRLHDHMHHNKPDDMIFKGEILALDLPGKQEPSPYYAVSHYTLDEPITPRALAKRLEERLDIRHIRIVGAADKPMTKLGCCFGAAGNLQNELSLGREIILTGEADEWSDAEYIRDAAAFGSNAALLIMGHVGSERDGMFYLARLLTERYVSELNVRYFDCGEVYTYTDI